MLSYLRFRKSSLSFLLVATYVAVALVHVYSRSRLLETPSPEPPLLSQSWQDLKRLTAKPHPYTSRANDEAHDWLVETASTLAAQKPWIDVADDYGQTRTILNQHNVFDPADTASKIIYFESGNILVRIQGSNPALEGQGLLVSAHYDSVPSGYGATDDGVGVITLLGVLRHFADPATPQPERTVVININDDEEFGLLGAEMFMKHEWAALTKYFINMDGAGSGGPAVLLRATDTGVLKPYTHVSKPFGNSLFQQGFRSRVVHSQTDYFVYEREGMRGVDIDFYKPRALYHTRRDSVTELKKGSLWHMQTMVIEYVSAAATGQIADSNAQGVYFSVFGHYFVFFPVQPLLILNVVLLTAVPALLFILLLFAARRQAWDIGLNGWLRGPISVAISISLLVFVFQPLFAQAPLLLVNGYVTPLVAATSLVLLANYTLLRFFDWISPVNDQKLVVLLELTAVSWAALIYATEAESSKENTAMFLFTLLYICFAAGSVIGLLGICAKSGYTVRILNNDNDEDSSTSYGAIPSVEVDTNDLETQVPAVSPQSHPLLQSVAPEPMSPEESSHLIASSIKEVYKPLPGAPSYDWFLQFLVAVPVPVYAMYSVGDLILDAIHQLAEDYAEGGYLAEKTVLVLATLVALPAVPFAHRINFATAALVAALFAASLAGTYYQPQTSYNNPIKLRFEESVELNNTAAVAASENEYFALSNVSVPVPDSYALVSGRAGFVEPSLREIPSVFDKEITCQTNEASQIETCRYKTSRPYLVDGSAEENELDRYLRVEVMSNTNDGKSQGRFDPETAVFKIHAVDNRMCSLSFGTASNKLSTVKVLAVYDEEPAEEFGIPVNTPSGHSTDEFGNHFFKIMKGIDAVQVHKLNWTQPYFSVGLEWLPFSLDDDNWDQDRHLNVTVRCFWGEYNMEHVVDGVKKRRLASYDEIVQFAPKNVLVANMEPGLLVVSREFML